MAFGESLASLMQRHLCVQRRFFIYVKAPEFQSSGGLAARCSWPRLFDLYLQRLYTAIPFLVYRQRFGNDRT